MKAKTKFVRLMMLAAVAVATSACNFEDRLLPERVTGETGQIAIECEVDPVVSEEITRAGSTSELPDHIINLLYTTDASGAPTTQIDKSKLAVRIWGNYDDPKEDGDLFDQPYARAWNSIAAYENDGVELERGLYQVRIENRPQMDKDGNIVEGVNNPYFAYETPEGSKFQVKALETTEVTPELKLINSCFKVQTTQALMDYYTDIELVIHTAKGKFTFNPTKTASTTTSSSTTTEPTNEVVVWDSGTDQLNFFNVSEPIKIDASKSNGLVETPQSEFTSVLKLSGHATKQNGVKVYFTKNGKADGEPAEIKPVDANNDPIDLAPSTMYTIRIGHSTAGSAGLIITYNDYATAEVTIIELRPEEDENDNQGTAGDNTSGEGEATE